MVLLLWWVIAMEEQILQKSVLLCVMPCSLILELQLFWCLYMVCFIFFLIRWDSLRNLFLICVHIILSIWYLYHSCVGLTYLSKRLMERRIQKHLCGYFFQEMCLTSLVIGSLFMVFGECLSWGFLVQDWQHSSLAYICVLLLWWSFSLLVATIT